MTDRNDTVDRDDDGLNRDDYGRGRDTGEDHRRVVDEVADRGDESGSGRGRLRRYVVTEITEDR